MPEWKEANDADRGALEASIPKGRRSSCSSSGASRGRRTSSSAATSSSRARPSTPGVPAFLHPLPAGRAADAADLRPLARRPQVADDGPGARQPRLAGVLRHRPGRHQRGPRHAERAAVASRAARLAGRRVHGPRLEPEAAAPADRRRRRPTGSRRSVTPELLAQRPVQPPAGARAAVPRRSRDRPRHRAGGQRPAEPEGRRPQRLSAGAGVPVPAAGQLRRRRSGTRRPGPTATAGRSTRSAAARCRTRCCRPSTRPNGDFACVRRRALEHAAAGADDAQRAAVRRMRPGAGAADARARAARPTPSGSTYAFRRCAGRARRPTASGTSCWRCSRSRRQRFAEGWAEPVRARRPAKPSAPPTLPAGRDAGAARPPGPSSRACC